MLTPIQTQHVLSVRMTWTLETRSFVHNVTTCFKLSAGTITHGQFKTIRDSPNSQGLELTDACYVYIGEPKQEEVLERAQRARQIPELEKDNHTYGNQNNTLPQPRQGDYITP